MTSHDDISEERAARYIAVQNSQEFAALRKKFRGFVFPMTGAFLAWYFLYVLLASYAIDFMATPIGGTRITIGLVLGSAAVRDDLRDHDVLRALGRPGTRPRRRRPRRTHGAG